MTALEQRVLQRVQNNLDIHKYKPHYTVDMAVRAALEILTSRDFVDFVSTHGGTDITAGVWLSTHVVRTRRDEQRRRV